MNSSLDRNWDGPASRQVARASKLDLVTTMTMRSVYENMCMLCFCLKRVIMQ